MQLVDHQSGHALDIAHRRQPRRETSRDAQLGTQIGKLARRGHLLDPFVGAMTSQRLGAALALSAAWRADGLYGQLWHVNASSARSTPGLSLM